MVGRRAKKSLEKPLPPLRTYDPYVLEYLNCIFIFLCFSTKEMYMLYLSFQPPTYCPCPEIVYYVLCLLYFYKCFFGSTEIFFFAGFILTVFLTILKSPMFLFPSALVEISSWWMPNSHDGNKVENEEIAFISLNDLGEARFGSHSG